MADALAIFSRILETLGVKNAPEAARLLGISKQSVYDWQKSTPSLENLIKVSESGNTSLHWLVTGEGNRHIHAQQQISVDEQIREIIRQEFVGKTVSPVAQEDALRDMIRDIVREEVGASRKRPVYPLRVADAEEDDIEETARRKVG